jgi:hypothetical protein
MLEPDTGMSRPFSFALDGPAVVEVAVEARDFSPVLVFHSAEGRGFEWDGALVYADYFFGPTSYDVRVRSAAERGTGEETFRLTVRTLDPEKVERGREVTGSFRQAGREGSITLYAWYEVTIHSPGEYEVACEEEDRSSLIVAGPGVDVYLSLRNNPVDSQTFRVVEAGIYVIGVYFYERAERSFRFLICPE